MMAYSFKLTKEKKNYTIWASIFVTYVVIIGLAFIVIVLIRGEEYSDNIEKSLRYLIVINIIFSYLHFLYIRSYQIIGKIIFDERELKITKNDNHEETIIKYSDINKIEFDYKNYHQIGLKWTGAGIRLTEGGYNKIKLFYDDKEEELWFLLEEADLAKLRLLLTYFSDIKLHTQHNKIPIYP